MVTVSRFRRRVRFLFLRWTILVRYHPNRAWIAGAVVIFVGIAASCWQFPYTNIPKWSERFGNSSFVYRKISAPLKNNPRHSQRCTGCSAVVSRIGRFGVSHA